MTTTEISAVERDDAPASDTTSGQSRLQASEARLSRLDGICASGDTMRDHFLAGPGCGPRTFSFNRQIEASREAAVLRPEVERMRRAVAKADKLRKLIAQGEQMQAEMKGKRGAGEKREALAGLLVQWRRELKVAERAEGRS